MIQATEQATAPRPAAHYKIGPRARAAVYAAMAMLHAAEVANAQWSGADEDLNADETGAICDAAADLLCVVLERGREAGALSRLSEDAAASLTRHRAFIRRLAEESLNLSAVDMHYELGEAWSELDAFLTLADGALADRAPRRAA